MTKKLVIAGVSAMQAWDEGARPYARPSRMRSPGSFASTIDELESFSVLPQGCSYPVDVLTGNVSSRHRSRKWLAHPRRSPLPSGSLRDIGNDRYLISPGFFFLQTAPKLSMPQAILLGMELCGYYSTLMSVPYRSYCESMYGKGVASLTKPWPPAEWEMSLGHQQDLIDNGFVVRDPLLNAEDLTRYLSSSLSQNSNSRALSAARLVVGDSRSPMESRLYARYCFPRRYGGLNLNPVELNAGFPLPEDIVRATGIHNYSVDLFWPDGAIGIEYQGRFAHSGLSAEQKDRLKRNILETYGVQIISVDREQYQNEDLLELFGARIAKSMGIPPWKQKLTTREKAKRTELIAELNDWSCDLYRPKSNGGSCR